jgi:hypothetical protein
LKVLVAVSALDPTQSFCAILIFYPLKLFGDLIESLVPRDLIPFPLTFFAGPLQRIIESIRVVHDFLGTESSETAFRPREYVIHPGSRWVLFNTDELPVLCMHEHWAVTLTEITNGLFCLPSHRLPPDKVNILKFL